MLTHEQVRQFIELHRHESGVDINVEAALESATKLVAVLELVLGLTEDNGVQKIKIIF